MEKVRVILPAEALRLTPARSIDGIIYVEADGIFFPDSSWFDLPAGVLDIWSQTLSRYLTGLQQKAVLPFMDGDDALQLIRQDSGDNLIQFLAGRTVQWEGLVDLLYFSRQILRASSLVLSRFPDQEHLRSSASAPRNALTYLK